MGRGRRGDCVPWSLTWTELSGKVILEGLLVMEKSVTVQDVSPEWNHSTLSQEPARNSNTSTLSLHVRREGRPIVWRGRGKCWKVHPQKLLLYNPVSPSLPSPCCS